MDLTKLTTEELEAHRIAVLTEQERRASLESIPNLIESLANTYEARGGKKVDLESRIKSKGTGNTPK